MTTAQRLKDISEASAERLDELYLAFSREHEHARKSNRLATTELLAAKARMLYEAGNLLIAEAPEAEQLRGTSVFYFVVVRAIFLRHAQRYSNLLTKDFDDIFTWAYEWHAAQRPTFVLSPSLMANLVLTDPGKVLIKDVALPFPAFRIVLPAGECPLMVEGKGTSQFFEVRSLGVNQSTIFKNEVVIPPTPAEGSLTDQLRRLVKNAKLLLESRATGERLGVRLFANECGGAQRNGPWDPERPVADLIGSEYVQARVFDTDFDPETVGPSEISRYSTRLAQRIAVNLALYLSSEDENTGKPTWQPADKTQKGAQYIDRLARIYTEVIDDGQ